MHQPRFLRQAPAHRIELAVAQGIDQLAAERDLVSISADEAPFRQGVDPSIERGADFGTETGAREIGRFAGNQAPIEPGRPFGCYLLVEIEVGTDGKRDPLPTPRILKATQLHNATDRTVAGRIDVGKLEVMYTPIDPVNDGKRCSPSARHRARGR